jgi:hypothetical protein
MLSAQDMIKGTIAGQRDPEVLAALARRTLKAKHDARHRREAGAPG